MSVLAIKNNLTTDLKYNMEIKKAIKGDKEAFSYLIKEHKSYLYKTAFMYVKNEDKALEIFQETITKAITNIHKLENPIYFKTWITRILINTAYDINKSKTNFIEVDENNLIYKSESISIEERLDLYGAVDLLRYNYKTVIILKYFNDIKTKDIATIMNIPENTVKTYLTRAKNELKTFLKEDYMND
ncbi:MAG: sigma-70 family RNA polymerase sigma factor [Clostridium sp.]